MSYESFLKSQLYSRKSPNLIKLGFDFSTNNHQKEYLKIQSMLYSEYHIKCESMLTIMKKFNIPSSRTMDTLFRLFDIEARSFSECNKIAIMQNRVTPFNGITFSHIYHKTWYGEIVHLRSTYEEEFAKLLDEQRIKYFVEHLRIKYFDKIKSSYRIAIPDFYLPETNTIVEVKSTYWLNEEEMRNKKQSYLDLGYKFDLYLDHVLLKDW